LCRLENPDAIARAGARCTAPGAHIV
jgi:hypothetical protein